MLGAINHNRFLHDESQDQADNAVEEESLGYVGTEMKGSMSDFLNDDEVPGM